MQARSRSLLEIHLAVFLFGFPGLFGKWLALSPVLIVFGRVLFASLTLAAVMALGGRSFRVSPRRDVVLLLACGFVLAAHWTMFFKSVQVSSVAVGLLAYSSFPVFTAFLEPLLTRERWDPASLVYALLCVLGIGLIVPGFDPSDAVVRGVLWGLGAGLSFSLLSVLNRILASRHSSLAVAFHQDLFAALFLLPVVFRTGLPFSGRDWVLVAVLGVFCTAAAHTLFIDGMKRVGARTASVLSSLEPVYGILLALVFLKESPSLRTVSGGAVVLAAALAATVRARRTS
ncbi:MAG: permease [Candidatus Aminicenantes bacterium RBG_19FT_COMBO_65_30]|nr:MAG: permease [Candidatus Aminicenantes bacterium RBG_19FT_COMBO_65_30]